MDINYGSILGHSHRVLDYNNQDAIIIKEHENYCIGIIADGCGSGSNSEVGAQLGVQFVCKLIENYLDEERDWKPVIKRKIHSYSNDLLKVHCSNKKDFIRNYLLYTILGFVKERDKTTIFHCGDGVIGVGEHIQILNQNNRPTYVNNELINETSGEFEFEEITDPEVSILLGSDGVENLIDAFDKNEISEFQDFSHFISSEINYKNPIGLNKFLQKYSKKGILRDDCSIILFRDS